MRVAVASEVLEDRTLLSATATAVELDADLLISQDGGEVAGLSQKTLNRLEKLGTPISTNARAGEIVSEWPNQPVVGQSDPILPQTSQSSGVINLDQFRNDPRFAGIDGSGYSVVVIDTGIDLDHPFFGPDTDSDGVADRIVYHFDFYGANDSDASDFHGHGSNVASIVGSSDSTFAGMAPGVNIIALKVFPDNSGGAFTSDIEEALQWVVNNQAQYNIVGVNMSIGSGNVQSFANVGLSDEYAALAGMGVTTAVASGNSFYSVGSVQGVNILSADPNVLSVGAVYDADIGSVGYFDGGTAITTGPDRITPFTQRHSTLSDIFAPGAAITGASYNGGTVTMHGTSQASPHIAGLTALMQQLAQQRIGRQLSYDEVRSIMRSAATTINDGDDENDNVTNTNLNFPRVDIAAIGETIWNLPSGPLPDLDDQIAESSIVNLESSVAGGINATNIADDGDVDMFSITVSAGQPVAFDIDLPQGSLNSVLTLFDGNGNVLASNDDGAAPGEVLGAASYLEYTFATAGTYHIAVSGSPNSAFDAVAGTGDVASSEGDYLLIISDLLGTPSDQDDTISEANLISLNSSTFGEIDSSNIEDVADVDMYRFAVTAGQTVTFDIDRPTGSLDSILTLFDPGGGLIGLNDDGAAPGEGSTFESFIEYTFPTTGTYYIAVSGYPNALTFNQFTGSGDVASSEGDYELIVLTEAVDPGEPDPDDQISEAIPVAIGSSASGAIDANGLDDSADVDMYSFTVAAGDTVLFDIDRPFGSLDSVLTLFDSGGGTIASNDDGAAPGESSTVESFIEYTFTSGGTYYIAVSGYPNISSFNPITGTGDVASSEGAYQLILSLDVPDPGNSDPDDQISEATPISIGSTIQGSIDTSDIDDLGDVDMYSIAVTGGETVSFDIDVPSGNLDSILSLFDPSGAFIGLNDDGAAPGEAITSESFIEYTFPTTGTYYIAVSGYPNSLAFNPIAGTGDVASSEGDYTLVVTDPAVLQFDYGDAPNPYPTLNANNGAVHTATGPRLGAIRDGESNGAPSVLADGDDLAGSPDDEDGIAIGLMTAGESGFQISVDVQNAPTGALLDAWIDFDGNGVWDATEQIAASQAVVAGINLISFDVPANAQEGFTYGRFRLSTAGNLDPTGAASDGEVEDYRVEIERARGATFDVNGGQMTVRGTEFSDDILVRANGGIVEIVDGGTVINTGVSLASLTSIRILGSGNDDFLTLDSSLGAITGFIFGEEGNDTLTGGDGDDILNGGIGNDILIGGAGNDALTGDLGDDSLDGGSDDDRLLIDADDSSLQGGGGRDTADATAALAGINLDMVPTGLEVFFGSAFDDIVSAAGATTAVELRGNSGNDQLSGGNLGDLIFGGDGNDSLVGNDGGDYINGGLGSDSADGGLGDDRIDFESADSSVQGGGGTDTGSATGSTTGVNINMTTSGLERLIGSHFGDVITAAGSTAGVLVLGLGGNDQITGGSGLVDILLGGSDDDTIIGGDGGDIILGETGADSLDGGAGDDRIDFDENDTNIQGGTGTDQGFAIAAGAAVNVNMVTAGLEIVYGSAFNDVITAAGSNVPVQINGLAGDDDLTGGNAADVLRGGTDNDTLTGGPGDDALLGQLGADTFVIQGNDGTDFNAAEGDVLI